MKTQAKEFHNSGGFSSGNTVDFTEIRKALAAWMRAKQSLSRFITPEDFQSYVRPMYFVGCMSMQFFLISLPPNRRVVEGARNLRTMLNAALEREGYAFGGFCAYPTAEELGAFPDPSFAHTAQRMRREKESS